MTLRRAGRTCAVCRHSNNVAISAALRAGHSPRYVTRLYDLSRPAIERHRRVCLVNDPGLGYADDASGGRGGGEEEGDSGAA